MSDHSADLSANRPARAAEMAVAPTTGERDSARLRDVLVMVCISIVCLALTTLFYTQLGYSVQESLFAGIAIFAACLGIVGLQAQGRRNSEISQLKETIARLQSGAGQAPLLQSEGQPHHHSNAVGANAAKSGLVKAELPSRKPLPEAQIPAAIGNTPRWQDFNGVGEAHGAGTKPMTKEAVEAEQPSLAIVSGHHLPARPAMIKSAAPMSSKPLEPVLEAPLWPGTTLSTSDPMRDQWAFRPRESRASQPGVKQTVSASDAMLTAKPAGGRPAAFSAMDADLAHVQLKIKALADEVNAAESTRQKSAAAEPSSSFAKTYADTSAVTAALAAAPSTVASAIDDSIGALKAAAVSMLRDPPKTSITPARAPVPAARAIERSQTAPMPLQAAMPAFAPVQAMPATSSGLFGDLQIPASAQPIAVSAPPAIEPVAFVPDITPAKSLLRQPARLDRAGDIANAIEAGAIEVLLSPIVDLGSNGVSHYDLTFLIKTASGQTIESAEAELMLDGSGILALFDRARLIRASTLAARLASRQKTGSLLSPVTGRSITNAEFLEEFARIFEEREGIASQLVLTFSQADIEQFTPAAWQALSDMHAFGFRFALDQIDHLSSDFKMLARRGFAFAKLEAMALLNGIPSRERFVAADEACRVLAGAGLALVASGLTDEKLRARIFGFGIIFGQGQLFGAPRPIDVQAPANSGRTAAA